MSVTTKAILGLLAAFSMACSAHAQRGSRQDATDDGKAFRGAPALPPGPRRPEIDLSTVELSREEQIARNRLRGVLGNWEGDMAFRSWLEGTRCQNGRPLPGAKCP